MTLIDDRRSAWTTRTITGLTPVAPATRTGVRWHWAGGGTGLPDDPATAAYDPEDHARCLAQVKAWEEFHIRDRGWKAIGYNLLVCPHGRVIEGRGVDVYGAHSGSTAGNTTTYGVQFMLGTGERADATMLDRATRLERDLWAHSGKTLTSSGHRDDPQASTECPGDQIHTWAHSPHTLDEGDDMSLTAGLTTLLTDAANRIMGFLAQRYYVKDPDTGYLKPVAPGTTGAAPARALDNLDGNYLVRKFDEQDAKLDEVLRRLRDDGPVIVPTGSDQ